MQAKSNEAKDDEAQIDKARNDKALNDEATGFLQPILGDGRPLLLLTAGSLFFAGGFAIFLAATGEFLPHDIHYLGMSAADLCRIRSCRVVDFMVHDRSSFGGVMCGVAVLYVWLVVFPLKRGEQWAWWALWITGAVGFAGFLTYLGYGYLDTWHGAGTLLLLPVFLTGMVRARPALTVHGAVGYTDLGHLVPALAAALTLVAGLALGWPGAPGLERGRRVVRR